MRSRQPITRPPDLNTQPSHLVLVGGGHTHVHVLKEFASRPLRHARLTLISPESYATYSGMVPGYLARQYGLGDARIDVRALAARSGAAFLPDRVVRVDAARRVLGLQTRPDLTYDVLSLDVGSRPRAAERVAVSAPVAMVKPIEVAARDIDAAFAAPAPAGGRRVVVVGAGAGGTEIAFALAARLRREGRGTVTLCDAAPVPVRERGERASRAVARALADAGVRFRGSVEVQSVDAGGIRFVDGRQQDADLVVWATGAAGPDFLRESGLPVDERGFLRVGDDLRCITHPEIFAAGDCAAMEPYPELPKAGVYAVRQGPVLAANLRAAVEGRRRSLRFRPQRRFLSLLNTGDGKAILSYGRFVWHGRLPWRLKDRIDRAFIRRYALPPLEDGARMSEAMPRCGGCAAKPRADTLYAVLSRLDVPARADVIAGVAEADDAAVFRQPAGTLAVATADLFPPFTDDLYLVGQVAAANAASDLYAMGAEASAAIALVCLPGAEDRVTESALEHFLQGALQALRGMDIPLAGGHTVSGEQALLGFAMHGWVEPGRVLRKSGARPGDRLVLTKPLGTGVVWAAARAGVAPAAWVEAAGDSMRRSNGPAMRRLRACGVRACTDVSGFGLAGHLHEVLRAGAVGARLHAGALPLLPGALELLRAGWRSSAHGRNATSAFASAADTRGCEAACAAILFDPQTSGGLLAAVPADRADELCAQSASAGEAVHVVGEVTGAAGELIVVGEEGERLRSG